MTNKEEFQEAVSFIKELFSLECQALDAYREPEEERYNQLYQELIAFSASEAIRFHLAPRLGPLSDFEQQMYALVPAANRPRHLFFLEAYPHPEGGSLMAAYCSSQNPPEQAFLLGERWWLRPEEETAFKIIAFDKVDDLDREEPALVNAAGIEGFSADELGAPQFSFHLLSPQEDPFGKKLYQANV
ncbi:MAG: hypothetical protein AAGF89_00790 [Bacteroidota bacterium]